jgi:hypothetical protein
MERHRAAYIFRQTLVMLGCCAAILMWSAATSRADAIYNYRPEGGYVSTPKIAIAIAEIILKSIYGDQTINAERPLSAKLTSGGIWIVQGSFKRQPGTYQIGGGVAEIWISKSDGRILRVSHGE